MHDTTHPRTFPRMVYANTAGEIMDFPDLEMAGRSGAVFRRPEPGELMPLPRGSELFTLPGRFPVGIDPADGRPVKVTENPSDPGSHVQAVAAFVAPAHTTIYTAAYERAGEEAPTLPLFAYTAVGWRDDRFWVAAFRSDPDVRQDAAQFNRRAVRARTSRHLKQFPENRLIQHLGRCCLTYNCPAARNYFLGRWEAPVPTSPRCNASCAGCISLQTSGCCPSTQERISFVPTPEEIIELAVPHLERAPRPVISFGQGCEGEPLLQAKVIERSIRSIRKQTPRGTINLNTNASLPDRVERLARAGLDSIRVSLNSAREEAYMRYYCPRGYSFANLAESARMMKKAGKFVSLNYFILPGFTDDPEEAAAFSGFVERCNPDLIQLRNLNMDPDWYLETVGFRPSGTPIGILTWLENLRKEFPRLGFGYFNPCLRP